MTPAQWVTLLVAAAAVIRAFTPDVVALLGWLKTRNTPKA